MNEWAEPKLLIYSQDGLGLGHLRRTTLLAHEFLRARPGASALTISDSPLGPFFMAGHGHDFLKLPSIRKAAPGHWHPVALASPFDDVLALRRATIRSAVLHFRPHVVLVDHMPHGAMGELLPTLQELDSLPVRVVLGLRDILDAPAVIRERWRLEGAFDAVERHYDEVLVYGSRDVFDVSAEYSWPVQASSRMSYCGYVCSPPEDRPVQRVRNQYLRGDKDASLVVAMAGGGADGFPLFDALLDSAATLTRHRRAVLVIVTGPFLPAAQRLELVRRARHLPVHVLTSVPDSLSYLGAADAVVAMAGYNTTAEILSLGKPALLVPRAGPSTEQRTRARLLAERGWVRYLAPESLGASTLAAQLLDLLESGSPAPAGGSPDLNGRQVAARRLLAALERGDEAVQPTSPISPLEVAVDEQLITRGSS